MKLSIFPRFWILISMPQLEFLSPRTKDYLGPTAHYLASLQQGLN